jgi:hypothetical protein
MGKSALLQLRQTRMRDIPKEELAYWLDRLAEPKLLETAVLLDVQASEVVPLAVPVGKLRRGGHIEFTSKREAQKGFRQVKDHPGFPGLRVIRCKDPGTRRPMRYYELRWGERPPFDGCDYGEPICALVLGVHYGYRIKAVAGQVQKYQRGKRRPLDRNTILRMIETIRDSHEEVLCDLLW